MFWKVPEFSENPLDTWIETNYETIYETNFPDFGWFREMESVWKTQTSCKNRDVEDNVEVTIVGHGESASIRGRKVAPQPTRNVIPQKMMVDEA